MIRNVGFAIVFATDYGMMRDWYKDVLQLTQVEVSDEGQWAAFTAGEGGTRVAIHGGIPVSRGEPGSGVAPIVLALEADDLSEAVNFLKEKGVRFHKDVRPLQGIMNAADVFDPEGNLIQLYEFTNSKQGAS